MIRSISSICLLFLLFFFIAVSSPVFAAELEFNRDVRPILSDKCFHCHGLDAKNQKSEFRIDSFDNATKDLGGYAGIVPGDVEKSETHHRIYTDDPDEIMPPPKTKKTLTEKEKQILDQWIKEGAQYEEHWAFLSLADKIEVPNPTKNKDRVRNEIDSFVLARLEAEGLEPAPETSREKWLRRVTFDLTGLPPTLKELDDFLADESPDAYEKVVARLFDTGCLRRTHDGGVARRGAVFGQLRISGGSGSLRVAVAGLGDSRVS